MKKTRTIAQLKARPEVDVVYLDSDGWWADFVDGWQWFGCHGIHEDTVADLLSAFDEVTPCECEWCVKGLEETNYV